MTNKGLKAHDGPLRQPPLTPPKGELGMPGGPYGFQILQKLAVF